MAPSKPCLNVPLSSASNPRSGSTPPRPPIPFQPPNPSTSPRPPSLPTLTSTSASPRLSVFLRHQHQVKLHR
nr:PREDICTED: serine/threonine-protein kinase WNK4-like [Opisthocomus hoazin]